MKKLIDAFENLEEYHAVFAEGLRMIANALHEDDESAARRLMIYLIRYAYTTWRVDEDDELTDGDIGDELAALEMDRMDIDRLQVKMFYYMSKAGIKPVQSYDKPSTFDMVRSRMKGWRK